MSVVLSDGYYFPVFQYIFLLKKKTFLTLLNCHVLWVVLICLSIPWGWYGPRPQLYLLITLIEQTELELRSSCFRVSRLAPSETLESLDMLLPEPNDRMLRQFTEEKPSESLLLQFPHSRGDLRGPGGLVLTWPFFCFFLATLLLVFFFSSSPSSLPRESSKEHQVQKIVSQVSE